MCEIVYNTYNILILQYEEKKTSNKTRKMLLFYALLHRIELI
jgi:hypothetical protein